VAGVNYGGPEKALIRREVRRGAVLARVENAKMQTRL